jgi:hypothetical protein
MIMKRSLVEFLSRFINNSPGVIGCLLSIACVLFINVWFVLGYIVGTTTGKSYDNKVILTVDPFHVFGCVLGLIIGWLIKGFVQGF